MFHVSQLKKRVGRDTGVSPQLSLVGPEGKLKVEPVGGGGQTCGQTAQPSSHPVRWSNLAEADATWEDYEFLSQFPDLILGDKNQGVKGGVSHPRVQVQFPVGGEGQWHWAKERNWIQGGGPSAFTRRAQLLSLLIGEITSLERMRTGKMERNKLLGSKLVFFYRLF